METRVLVCLRKASLRMYLCIEMTALKDKDHNDIIFNGIGTLLRKPGGSDSVKVAVQVRPLNEVIILFLFISSTNIV